MDYEEFEHNVKFDMNAFLNDFRTSSISQPGKDLLIAISLLHHMWIEHPLKLSTGVTLVALSPDLVFDASDVQYIRKDGYGDYLMSFKSYDNSIEINGGTPEFEALERFIASLAREEENEH